MDERERRTELRDAWEAHAAEWIRWARAPGHDSYWRFHRDAFFRLVPPPGSHTLDLGCGEGRVARDLRDRGHRVTAVDPSPTLIHAAREADPEGTYLEASADALPFDDAMFDTIVAFMTLHDMDDLDGALRECARVLRPRGVLVAAIVHPINSAGRFESEAADSPFVIEGSYLDERSYADAMERDGLRMTFHSRHRSLEAYSHALERVGLVIDALREPPAGERGSARNERWRRLPLFLHFRARSS